MSASASQLERNKAIVRSFKECQGTREQDATMREIMAPDYKRIRGGLVNLAENAEGQDFPAPGLFLRKALPDRVDVIEDIVAEGDRVAMLWRLKATHTGDLFGIPPTGKKIHIYEVGFFRVIDGKIVEGWFMADELGLLIQLGRQMPRRGDGRVVAPHVSEEGESRDAIVERLMNHAAAPQDRNKLKVARSKSTHEQPEDRAASYIQSRWGFQHLRDHRLANGTTPFDPRQVLPDGSDRIVRLLAEREKVWTRLNMHGTNTQGLDGLTPTHRHCVVSEVGICRFAGEQWVEGWYFADELGLLLQLDAMHMLEKLGCAPVE